MTLYGVTGGERGLGLGQGRDWDGNGVVDVVGVGTRVGGGGGDWRLVWVWTLGEGQGTGLVWEGWTWDWCRSVDPRDTCRTGTRAGVGVCGGSGRMVGAGFMWRIGESVGTRGRVGVVRGKTSGRGMS